MQKSNSRGNVLTRKDFNSATPKKKLTTTFSQSSHHKTCLSIGPNGNADTTYAASSGGVSYAEL